MRVSISWHEGSKYRVGLGKAISVSASRSVIPVCILDKTTKKKFYRNGYCRNTENSPIWVRLKNSRVRVAELLEQ